MTQVIELVQNGRPVPPQQQPQGPPQHLMIILPSMQSIAAQTLAELVSKESEIPVSPDRLLTLARTAWNAAEAFVVVEKERKGQ